MVILDYRKNVRSMRVYHIDKIKTNHAKNKQPSRGALRKRCSEQIQQIYRREHPSQSVISIKFLCNFIEITIWHGCFPVNLLYMFRIPASSENVHSSIIFWFKNLLFFIDFTLLLKKFFFCLYLHLTFLLYLSNKKWHKKSP